MDLILINQGGILVEELKNQRNNFRDEHGLEQFAEFRIEISRPEPQRSSGLRFILRK